jgi:putative ABC transport system permease protein
MRAGDCLRFALYALTSARLRSALMLLAMSIGVASVVLLTSLGEGARRYVVNEFSELGSHLLIMLPGRFETTGGAPPMLGQTPRDLTLMDAGGLLRSHHIERIAPITVGNAPVSHDGLEREVTILGSTADLFVIRHLNLGSGRALPEMDLERSAQVVVLGAKLRDELFRGGKALGAWVRISDRRFRVIGVLADEGESLGQDLGDMAIIPVASAQSLFDTQSLFRVLIQARSLAAIPKAEKAALEIIRQRHDGEDDVTIIAQDALLKTFDGILRALTYTVGGIAAISLGVAGILIMNVMLVAVTQRTAEIGLLKALGAAARQVQILFLVESVLLALTGAITGLLLSAVGIATLARLFPSFPVAPPPWAPLAAVAVAVLTGLVFGVVPARRAARLDPVRALTGR